MSDSWQMDVDAVKEIQQMFLAGECSDGEYLAALVSAPPSAAATLVAGLPSEGRELLVEYLAQWPHSDQEWAEAKVCITGSCVPEMRAAGMPEPSVQDVRRLVEAYRAALRTV